MGDGGGDCQRAKRTRARPVVTGDNDGHLGGMGVDAVVRRSLRGAGAITRAGVVCEAGGSVRLVLEVGPEVLDIAAGSAAWAQIWRCLGVEPPSDHDLGPGGDLAGALLELLGARIAAREVAA